jgi:prepilin-type N-terminal cleavage/methylation domain-containing protein
LRSDGSYELKKALSPDIQTTRGFTLIEVLAVLAIMVIIAGIAVAAFLSSRGTAATRAAVTNVHGGLSRARQESVTSRQPTQFRYGTDGDGNGYYVIEPCGGGDLLDRQYLPEGTAFGGSGTVAFAVDGSCDPNIGNWSNRQTTIIVSGPGGSGLVSTTVVYQATGRLQGLPY